MTTLAAVDLAFRRLFRARIKLGMLDPPTLVPWNTLSNDSSVVESPEHIALARLAAQQSMCLYKNANNVLPLSLSPAPKIALIGPQAIMEFLLLGNYAQYPDGGIVSILEGLTAAVGQNVTANCSFEQDIDYYQAGQIGIPVYDPTVCCHLCSANTSCHYFTFFEGLCYLKSTNAGRQPSNGRVSGSCNSQTPLQYQPGCNSASCTDSSGERPVLCGARQSQCRADVGCSAQASRPPSSWRQRRM